MGLFGNKTEEIKAVCNVNIDRYLGVWYEVARFPHTFEKGLNNVTATYNLKSDGKIEVINSGIKDGNKKVATAVAWIPDKNCTGKIFVSFFRPFKSLYKIIKLDEENYKYAVITSSSMNYLWILSRESKINEKLYDDLISFAASKGFDITKIIKVDQSKN